MLTYKFNLTRLSYEILEGPNTDKASDARASQLIALKWFLFVLLGTLINVNLHFF